MTELEMKGSSTGQALVAQFVDETARQAGLGLELVDDDAADLEARKH